MNLIEVIQKAVKPMLKKQSFRAIVKSVDKANDTCEVDPLITGATYFDVKLKSVVDSTNSKCVLYPKVGSAVTVSLIGNNSSDVFVSQYSDFESIQIENQKFSMLFQENGDIKVKAENIEFNTGSLGGLIKINELKTQINKNTQMLKTIQQIFKSWTPASGDGGAVLKGLSTSFSSMPLADLSNIENKKITHG
jgi:hypothetical protein